MKACFIGLGSIGARHCLNLMETCRKMGLPLALHAVRSSEAPLRESLQSLDLKQLRSFDQMDDDYDLIFITNPTSLHYDTLLRVGGRGRCFFIEKPVFDDPDRDISVLPLKENAVCYVAAPLRYTSVIRVAREFVAQNRVFSARAISSSYLPDWRPGQDYRQTYSARRDLGGGVSIDLIHEWDYLSMLFGIPDRVYHLTGKYSDLEIDSDDLAVYIAAYPTHLVEVHLDYFGRETRRELELYTRDGCWRFDIAHSRVVSPAGNIRAMPESPNDKYLREMEYFISLALEERPFSENDIEHANRVLRIATGEEY